MPFIMEFILGYKIHCRRMNRLLMPFCTFIPDFVKQ
jgi:hypothetical protein